VSAKKQQATRLTAQVLRVDKEHSGQREGTAPARRVVARAGALDQTQALFAKENGRVDVACLQRRLTVSQRKQRARHFSLEKNFFFLLRESLANLSVGKGAAETVRVAAANLQH
jgi:hypothetical protein